jgi:hypothetical protein
MPTAACAASLTPVHPRFGAVAVPDAVRPVSPGARSVDVRAESHAGASPRRELRVTPTRRGASGQSVTSNTTRASRSAITSNGVPPLILTNAPASGIIQQNAALRCV